MADIPEPLQYGEINLFIYAFAADSADTGERPDLIGLNGKLVITALQPKFKVVDGTGKALVFTNQPQTCRVVDGIAFGPGAPGAAYQPIKFLSSRTAGLSGGLNAIKYSATFTSTEGTKLTFPSFEVPIGSAINLADALDYTSNATISIVSEATRIAAELARDAAEGYRDEAEAARDAAVAPTAEMIADTILDPATTAGEAFAGKLDSATASTTYETPAGATTKAADAAAPKLNKTDAAAMYDVLPPSNTVLSVGDSISAQNQTDAGAEANGFYDRTSWLNHARRHLPDNTFRVVGNAGIGGNKTADLLARLSADVLTKPGDWVALNIGVNDLFDGTGTTVATIKANLTSIVEQILATGKSIAWNTPTPSGFGTPTTISNLHEIIRWIKEFAANHRSRIVVIDMHAAVVDPADGFPFAGYPRIEDGTANRGVHPGYLGCAAMGRAWADAMRPHLTASTVNVQAANAGTRNLMANGLFVGSTAGLAPNWLLQNIADGSAATTATPTKITRMANGRPKEFQQIVVASGSIRLFQQNTTPGASTWQPGDKVQLRVLFETDADTAGAYQVTASVVFWNGLGSVSDFTSGGADNLATWPGHDVLPRRGILQTPPRVIPAGTARLQVAINLPIGTTRPISVELVKVA